jgi:hypothetical protein
MSLSDLAALGSFVSGLAVLVSLVFLYFQLRQVTAQIKQGEKNQRALLDQGTVARNSEIIFFHAQPHINDLTTRVAGGDTHFTAAELGLLSIRVRTSMLAGQDTYVQNKAGLTDPVTVDNSEAVLRYVLSQPVYRALWYASRGGYAAEWRDYVDKKLIAGLPLAKPIDAVAQFEVGLAKVLAPDTKPPGDHEG